jgi:sigma-54 dependent transcriptional regulator, acetoin dehydrogenase operon transcriptional activator AcoR
MRAARQSCGTLVAVRSQRTQSVTRVRSARTSYTTTALFLVLEGERPALPGARYVLSAVDLVRLGRGAERRYDRRENHAALRVPDPKTSTEHAVLERSLGRWRVSDAGSKNGTFVDGAQVTSAWLDAGAVVQIGNTTLMLGDVSGEAESLDLQGRDPDGAGLWTLLPELESAFGRACAVVAGGTPVLVGGPTGTGKEVLARALHDHTRRGGPFVAVNCGALAAGVVESELFGHRRGAFSGSVDDHLGLIRQADHGTLLLDEIAELPAAGQVALLRVLETRCVRPVGSTQEHAVDLRVLASTNSDLRRMVAAGSFRADLYARIAGDTLMLPPLARRRQDLSLFVRSALAKLERSVVESVRFDAGSTLALLRHDWPLNGRELAHAVANLVALSAGERIRKEHMDAVGSQPMSSTLAPATRPRENPEDARRRTELVELLRRHSGNVSAAARELGKDRRQIHRWLERLAIDPSAFR